MARNPYLDRPPYPPSRGGIGVLVDLGPGVGVCCVALAPRRPGYPVRPRRLKRRCSIETHQVPLLLFLLLLPLLLCFWCRFGPLLLL